MSGLNHKHYNLDSGNGIGVMISSEDATMVLANYNEECARGIIHTDEWKESMKMLQDLFNKGELT